jgi:hypothetical protein
LLNSPRSCRARSIRACDAAGHEIPRAYELLRKALEPAPVAGSNGAIHKAELPVMNEPIDHLPVEKAHRMRR